MSYLSYYNMFSDFTEFNAGSSAYENELFSSDEEATFLPRVGEEESSEDPNGKYYPNLRGYIPNILMRNDIKSLIGFILLVLAVTSTPIIAVIMIAVASALLPFPSLVIAYCLSIQITCGGTNTTFIMSVVCVILSLITIFMSTISKTAYTISYIILAVLFCIYAYNINKVIGNEKLLECRKKMQFRRDIDMKTIGDFQPKNVQTCNKPSFYES
ncbi:MV membrane protein [Brazilian porcupinepox virus 1]|nr:MV membrane protein [Brazilian porcupinepox virus 1]